MEWAASIPGTVGGAVYGNAGAYGSDMASSLVLVEILHRDDGKTSWPVERLEYSYRSSLLKRECLPTVVLAASVRLEESTPEVVQEKMKQNIAHRLLTQPPGASMGSMFKNPPGDYAGRLIEAAGLKGKNIGSVQISDLHGNFCINLGKANAKEVYQLVRLAQKTVEDKFGISLELEIELVGEWKEDK